MIPWMAEDHDHEHRIGPMLFKSGKIIGPNGLPLFYDDLMWDGIERQWTYSFDDLSGLMPEPFPPKKGASPFIPLLFAFLNGNENAELEWEYVLRCFESFRHRNL